MKLIRAQCCAQSRPLALRVDHHSVPRGAQFSDSLAKMKDWYFVLECCNQNAIFFRCKPSKQVISGWYIDKPVIYRWFPARSQQQISEWWKFQHNLLQVLTQKYCRFWLKIYSKSVSAIWEGWLQCIASVMQWLLTLQNHSCMNSLFCQNLRN